MLISDSTQMAGIHKSRHPPTGVPSHHRKKNEEGGTDNLGVGELVVGVIRFHVYGEFVCIIIWAFH